MASSSSTAHPPPNGASTALPRRKDTNGGGGPAQVKPPVVVPGTGNNIIVNPCQRGNPVLECIRNVGKEFGEIVADYQVGRTTGVLFLSLRYHRLHPEYIHQRIERLGVSYNLRLLLLVCDVSEHQDPIRELTKICLINNITIMTAWNVEEAGYYLSTFKQFEHKPPDMIKERVDKDYHSVLRTALTSISRVNKTDVEILRTSIGSFADIAKASSERLLQLPGFGQVKVKRMKDAFERPFRNNATSALSFESSARLSQSRNQGEDGADVEAEADVRLKGEDKGKERAVEEPETELEPTGLLGLRNTSRGMPERRTREESPVWDIELDLNESPEPEPPRGSSTRKRPPSPVWDIELDLNDSDIDDFEDTTRKRHKPDSSG